MTTWWKKSGQYFWEKVNFEKNQYYLHVDHFFPSAFQCKEQIFEYFCRNCRLVEIIDWRNLAIGFWKKIELEYEEQAQIEKTLSHFDLSCFCCKFSKSFFFLHAENCRLRLDEEFEYLRRKLGLIFVENHFCSHFLAFSYYRCSDTRNLTPRKNLFIDWSSTRNPASSFGGKLVFANMKFLKQSAHQVGVSGNKMQSFINEKLASKLWVERLMEGIEPTILNKIDFKYQNES